MLPFLLAVPLLLLATVALPPPRRSDLPLPYAAAVPRSKPKYHTTATTRFWLDGKEVTSAVFAAADSVITELLVDGDEVLTIRARAK